MKRTRTALLAGSVLAAMTAHPLSAQRMAAPDAAPQIARAQDRTPTVAAARNVSAPRPGPAAMARTGGNKTQPPGAQALMVLGVALIVTPAMFRGAFSN